jgi:uncharacterized protein
MASTRIPRPLDAIEIRVLGSLLEKEQTTPELYPLTVNSLLAACNQKTNREPVMELTETQVVDALDRLRQEVLVWRTEGARSEKWQQSVSRRWSLDAQTKALLTLLLLRGAQTSGELRSRSERLQTFPSVEAVEAALSRLAAGDEPFVRELPRRPGQKEIRWMHLIGDPAALEIASAPLATREPRPVAEPNPGPATPLATRVHELESRVEALERELSALRERLGDAES